MEEFKKGTKIKINIGGEAEIIQWLGKGGQGTVYMAGYNGKKYALKWYSNNTLINPDKFYDNINNNIKHGAPTDTFLWPLMLTEHQYGSFGYLMDLRPQEYEEFPKFLRAKVKFPSLSQLINAALNIVNSFRELHRCGYSYQDLNDGNFFINPKNGDVLICDNDNVAPYGENLGIAGKCRYMAPEVVLGEKLPDVHTDRFSLAVTLFLLLFVSHPLEGKKTVCPCMTENLERKYFGIEPVFTYDPNNDTNRPERGIHTNAINLWPLFPRYIQEAFIKSFCDGMKNQNERITETQWQKLFVRLRDETILCRCGDNTFIDISSPSTKCSNCGRDISRLLLLKVKDNKVVLYPKTKIYKCHTDADSDDFKEITGEVVQNKSNPGLWGLRNLSNNTWYMSAPDGKQKDYGKGDVVPILKGIKINFGGNNAEII